MSRKRIIFSPFRIIRYFYLRFQRLRGNPRSLALGTAIGVFIGLTPTLPFHTVSIIPLTILCNASTLAALISGFLVSNPLTIFFHYYFAWVIGNFLFPGRLTWTTIQSVLGVLTEGGFAEGIRTITGLGFNAILVMLSGGILLALPLAILSYCLSYRFFLKIKQKRREKHLLK